MSLPTTTLTSDLMEQTTITPAAPSIPPPLPDSHTIMDMWMSQLQEDHPEISFVIPSHHDREHIDNMVNVRRLLEQLSNHTAYDTIAANMFNGHHNSHILRDSMGQTITPDQISNSAVLNMADLKNNALTGLERFFAGTDMNSLINYLWIGVVTSLVVLTVIFVLFSCYFYRKFREWKKCNKDIRASLNNDMYPGGNSLMPCDSATNPEAAYYQMESPPCYTIATGLPTYDEALHNHQQHFAFGMKFIYPTLAAVHHQASNLISSWEKYDMQSKDQKTGGGAATTVKFSKCKSSQTNNMKSSSATTSSTTFSSSETSSATPSSLALELTNASSLLLPPQASAPPCYDMPSYMALLSEHHHEQLHEEHHEQHHHLPVTCDNVTITMPQFDTSNTSAKTSSDLTDIITV